MREHILLSCQSARRKENRDRVTEGWRSGERGDGTSKGGWGSRRGGAPAASLGLTLIRHDTHTPGKKSDKCNQNHTFS